jgi:hypothetical protein
MMVEKTGNFIMRQKRYPEHRLTASEQCKAAGLKSLADLAEMVRKPPQTLRNWQRDSPELFAVVVAGAVVIKAANV